MIFNRVGGSVGGHYYHLDLISLVCKRFLSISNFVRRTFTISDPRILLHCNLSKLFQRFNHINCICIQNCIKFHHEDFDRVIVEIARSGLNLEDLNRRRHLHFSCETAEEGQVISCHTLSAWNAQIENTRTLKNWRTRGPQRRSTQGQWTAEEDKFSCKAVQLCNGKSWKRVGK